MNKPSARRPTSPKSTAANPRPLLRPQAKKRLATGRFSSRDPRVESLQALVHELQAQLKEVELQNQPLRQSEERYRTLAESSSDWDFWVGLEGQILYMSKSCERVTGYWAEAFLQNPELLVDLVHPEDRARFRAHRNALGREEGGAEKLEFRIVRRDGQVRWIGQTCQLVKDKHGAPCGFRAGSRDITEHKQTEETLRRQAQIIEQIHDAVVGTDLDGRITLWNVGAERVFGYTAAEALGRPVSILYFEEDLGILREQVISPLRASGQHNIEVRCRRKSGETRYIHLSLSLLRNPQGIPYGMIGYSMDVTERRRAEQARLESEDRFRSFMDNSATIAWMKDDQGRHVYLSKTYERRFGVRLEDWLGKTDFELWPKEVAEQFWKNDQAVLAKGQPIEVTEETTQPDGSRCFWWDFKFPFQDSSGRRYVGGIGVDVTARKQLEAELSELNAHLEQRVAERTVLAEERAEQLRLLAGELVQAEQGERDRVAQVLHDHLQQILIAIQYRLELLKGKRPEADWPAILRQSRRLLKEAIVSTRSLSVELNPPVLKAEGFGAALAWLRSWMKEKYGLRLLLQVEAGAELADPPTRLLCFQAVRELLVNVVKHAGVRHVRVKVQRVMNSLTQIIVADQGVGFDVTGSRAASGSQQGLGLRSVRQRLEMIGGVLDIDSAPGKGTKVTILVSGPTQEAPGPGAAARVVRAPPPTRAGKPPVTGRRRIRVLLADDHRILREGLAGVLGLQPDLEVVGEAADGSTAVQLAHRLHPDVVVMDVSMPRLDGVEATRQIRRELPRLRVVGLSMHEDPVHAKAMRAAGATAYLCKTGPTAFLLDAIRRCARARTTGLRRGRRQPVRSQG
jgi:PAS domain S-box-containing protein